MNLSAFVEEHLEFEFYNDNPDFTKHKIDEITNELNRWKSRLTIVETQKQTQQNIRETNLQKIEAELLAERKVRMRPRKELK